MLESSSRDMEYSSARLGEYMEMYSYGLSRREINSRGDYTLFDCRECGGLFTDIEVDLHIDCMRRRRRISFSDLRSQGYSTFTEYLEHMAGLLLLRTYEDTGRLYADADAG